MVWPGLDSWARSFFLNPAKVLLPILPCNSKHSDFLYYVAYAVGEKHEIIKVCSNCYRNEDCFNNKEVILEIRSLDGELIWQRPSE